MVIQGDVLVSTVRPNLKNIAVVRDNYENMVASTGFCVLRPIELINVEYLFTIVNSDTFAEYLSRIAKGANYPAVNGSDIKNFKIPLPPLSLQNIFAEFVKQADKSKYIDWAAREDIKNELNMDLTKLLYNNGYPPEWDDEVFERVLEQSENYKKYSVVVEYEYPNTQNNYGYAMAAENSKNTSS